ncbi:PAS domain S-box protein [candidate division KSB1 bacterium]|nr:PAS domain S-box protein [candidate division KSB1 bacterium]
MLRYSGFVQIHRNLQGWVRRCWERAHEFPGRRLAGMSFRNRLLTGTILLVVTYGVIVTTVGLWLLQPSLLQHTFENGRARSTHTVRHLEPLFTAKPVQPQTKLAHGLAPGEPIVIASVSVNHKRLGEELDNLLATENILRCIVYATDLQPILQRGSPDPAPDAELDRLIASLHREAKPIEYVIRHDGVQNAFVTIRPLLAQTEGAANGTSPSSVSAPHSPAAVSAGYLRLDYDLTFAGRQRWQFYKLNLAVMALFLSVGIALALLLSRQLHQPMRRLIEGAQRLGSGDFSHRIEIGGHNELALLGKSFNRMASHLKQRETQLQHSEALYRHLIQDALDGIFVVDRELRFVEVNEKFCEMAGCRREELLQSTLNEVLAKTIGSEELVSDLLDRRPVRGELVIQPQEEFSPAFACHSGGISFAISPALTPSVALASPELNAAFSMEKTNGRSAPSNGTPHVRDNYESLRQPANGTLHRPAKRGLPRTIDLNAAPITDALYMGMGRDVTEKKHYESELHRAAELRELLLRTMNDGIAVLDRAGDLLISNRALEEILEMSPAALMQHRFMELNNTWEFCTLNDQSLPPENNPIHLALNAQRRVSDFRLKIRRPGTEKYLSVNAAPLYDERVQLIGAIVALRDITAAVQSERAREMLQQKVQQTAKLASLGELAAGVAHEINNPMTGIINYAKILYDRAPKNEEKQLLLQGIMRESDRVTKIVHNLLTFARQQPQERSWAGLADILDSSLHLIEHQLRKDGITLILEVSPDLPPLNCRSQQIQQVFINLLSNAHHALNEKYPGPHENKLLKIAAREQQRNGHQLIHVEFYDAGIGMAPEILPKIFDPFFTTKRQAEGTGLGLSISYGIIKEHQGEIFVESELGDHTAFVIELPTELNAAEKP